MRQVGTAYVVSLCQVLENVRRYYVRRREDTQAPKFDSKSPRDVCQAQMECGTLTCRM